MLELSNVSLPLDAGLEGQAGKTALYGAIARILDIPCSELAEISLLKRSVDARKKSNVHFVATVAVLFADQDVERGVELDAAHGTFARRAPGMNVKRHEPFPSLEIPDCAGFASAAISAGAPRPVVVGTGPAGLFAALYLAKAGLRPLVFERGESVDDRTASVAAFSACGVLNVNSNIQFGEGGAGTFSDGKLNTGTKSPHIRHVLQAFVDAGAPEEILWQAKPHIGTDKLVNVVRTLREQIVAAGGEVRFNALVENFYFETPQVDSSVGALEAIDVRDARTGEVERIPVQMLVLACGHSARDTFATLHKAGVCMERKPFAVGVRIEHPQQLIDQVQYGEAAEHPALGAADYKLAVHLPDGRGVYTFCMCPGGEVVAAASEEGGVCVNGMSRFARDGHNANSALLVEVRPDDLPGSDPLAGVEFQREIERAAFRAGMNAGAGADANRRPYAAPAQTVGSFLGTEVDAQDEVSLEVNPTYPRGVTWCDLRECLPPFVADSLERAFPLLDRKLHGFAHPQAVMTAVEARSSSPVRIVRGEDMQAVSHKGIYPCGEGAGYAGGITSAAVDGLRVAQALAAEQALAVAQNATPSRCR